MVLIRNLRIFFIVIIITSHSLSASVWQRVEGVYNKVQTKLLIEYQNNLYIQSETPKQKIFLKTNEKWNLEPDGFLSTLSKILAYKENSNMSFVSSIKGNFRSFDYGETWELIDSLNMNNLVISDSVIYGQGQSTKEKLFKLEPNSSTWKPVTFLNDKNEIDTVIGDLLESKNNILLAADGAYLNKSEGVYISIDSGKKWYKSKSFNGKAVSLAIHNDFLYIGASDKHLYKSIDYGETWVVDTNKTMPIDKFISTDLGLIAAVNKIAELYNDESGIHISKNNGETWEKIDIGFEDRTISQFLEVNSKIFALDTKNYVYQYSNSFNKWSLQEILYDSLLCSDLIEYKDTLFISGKERGILYSTDKGTKWSIFNLGLDEKSISASKILRNEKMFVILINGISNDYYLISSDEGKNWKSRSIVNENGSNPRLYDFIIYDDKLIIATSIGIKYTTDFGESVFDLTGGELDSGLSSGRISIDDERNIYIPTTKGLLQSTDKGINWNVFMTVENQLKSNIWYFKIFNEERVYGFSENGDLFITTNQGIDWKLIGDEISEYYIPNDILEIQNSLVVVVGGGVVISNNSGITWEGYLVDEKSKDGKPLVFSEVLEKDGYLIAATDYGIWRAKLSDLGIVKSSVETEIERNYLYTYPPFPNPAKSEVKVLFYWDVNLPMTTDDISIYDLTGKRIDAVGKINLVKLESHYGNLIWDCSSAQPGIYLINIKHGTEEQAVKVVVE